MSRVSIIEKQISEIPFVEEIYEIKQEELNVTGKVRIAFPELPEPLDFKFEITPSYPLKNYDSESITFKNPDLVELKHVMGNGAICIHTSHNINLRKKLIIDFISLRNWIEKYYINKDDDTHYEHLIYKEKVVKDIYHSYVFTDVNYKFTKGEFGKVYLNELSNGTYKGKNIKNYIVQSFFTQGKFKIDCNWSSWYIKSTPTNGGAFIYIEDAPALYGKFAFNNWEDLKQFIPNEFLKFLHEFEKNNLKKYKGILFPIFIGYKTINSEIHWLVTPIEIGSFPIKGVAEKAEGKKTGKWYSELENDKISWSISRNSSYKYFFGRGALSSKITDKKVLIIGVGAIGSMVTKTLVRGGCKYIHIADYDVKEPENICRSEYLFNLGINDKTEEFSRILTAISPFVEVQIIDNHYFNSIIKFFYDKKEIRKEFVKNIETYDIIIDCTTDNDLMYILDSLNLKKDLINLSITNHAKALVCAFNPNIYAFVINQFNNVLENDVEDLYNPTGCWDPTFKASFNDIAVLVQMALKNINRFYKNNLRKSNFVIKSDESNYKIEEF
ncbi:MAG: ThiF family adenylyltransferase [Aequorivita antarctica]